MSNYSSTFPWGTLLVNAVGSTFLGMVVGFAMRRRVRTDVMYFLAAGFCGGFTTFSAFQTDSFLLLVNGEYLPYIGYVAASVLVCLAGVAVGVRLIAGGAVIVRG